MNQRFKTKELTNIKNNDKKRFLWCHTRRISPIKKHRERIKREEKKLANDLDYDGIGFPVQEKYFSKTETETTLALTRIVMKIGWFF